MVGKPAFLGTTNNPPPPDANGRYDIEMKLRVSEAKRAALLEALTPSAETKSAYVGRVSEIIEDGSGTYERHVSWTAIRQIMSLARRRALWSKAR